LVYLNIYIFLDCIQQQSFGVYFCLHSSQIIKISYVNISTRISYSGDARLDSRIEGQAFMTDFHRSFLHALQTNSGAIGQPRNRRRPLSSTQFPIHYRKSSSHSMKQLIKDHTDWGFLRTECWGGYLDLEGRKTDHGENCIMMNFITRILHRILLGWLNQGGWGGRDMWHAWWRGEVLAGFWLGGRKLSV
jgi:hypothetical protein